MTLLLTKSIIIACLLSTSGKKKNHYLECVHSENETMHHKHRIKSSHLWRVWSTTVAVHRNESVWMCALLDCGKVRALSSWNTAWVDFVSFLNVISRSDVKCSCKSWTRHNHIPHAVVGLALTIWRGHCFHAALLIHKLGMIKGKGCHIC